MSLRSLLRLKSIDYSHKMFLENMHALTSIWPHVQATLVKNQAVFTFLGLEQSVSLCCDGPASSRWPNRDDEAGHEHEAFDRALEILEFTAMHEVCSLDEPGF